jgi:hypothetical protein
LSPAEIKEIKVAESHIPPAELKEDKAEVKAKMQKLYA